MSATLVTGIGVVAPNGIGHETYWSAVLRGDSGIRPLTLFDPERYPAQLAGEVRDFDPREWLSSRLHPQTDRMTRFALLASDWAVADSGADLSAYDPLDVGAVTAAGAGGFEFGQRELQRLYSEGPEHISAYMSFAWFYAVNTGQMSIRHGLRGPSGVLVGEQAGGLDVLGQARRMIRGGTRLVLAGGVEAALCPYGMASHLAGGGVSTASDPAEAYLPFSSRASGYVPGEGGAILTLEDESEVRARGGSAYGEIAGYAATFDPPRGSGRPSNLRRAAELALQDAGLGPGDVAVVFADAASRPVLDRAEAEAINALFGPRGVPVAAPKSTTGRLTSGAGPLDVAGALLALRDRVAPPTANAVEAAPGYDMDLVAHEPRRLRSGAALVLARGTGGFNAAVVLRMHAQPSSTSASTTTDDEHQHQHDHEHDHDRRMGEVEHVHP